MAKTKRFVIRGQITMAVNAKCKEEALAKAQKLVNGVNDIIDSTEVVDINFPKAKICELPF